MSEANLLAVSQILIGFFIGFVWLGYIIVIHLVNRKIGPNIFIIGLTKDHLGIFKIWLFLVLLSLTIFSIYAQNRITYDLFTASAY